MATDAQGDASAGLSQEVGVDKLVTALAPVFAAGFAVQQLLELLTSFLDLDSNKNFEKYKKAILGLISLLVGFALAFSVDFLRVLQPLFAGSTPPVQVNPWIDKIVTALVLSAGTEGINSVMKFLKYTKEDSKNSAAAKSPTAAGAVAAAAAVSGSAVPHSSHASSAALAMMNRK